MLFRSHERDVINVAEYLTIKDNCRWHAFVAHAKGVGLVVFAAVVNLVADILNKSAVLAFRIRRMALLTLFPLFDYPVVKALVFEHCSIGLHAVGALSTRWMLAEVLECSGFGVFLCHTEAVHTLLVRTVPAF